MGFNLSGKRILITGASSGIGAATARLLAKSGAHVALVSERAAELGAVAEAICAEGGLASGFVADFTCPEQVEGLVARVESGIGPLDALVNNAGIGLRAPVLETRPEDLRFLFEVNFFSLASLSRQALLSMGARGKGRIINVSSAAGRFGCSQFSAYSATKGAVHAFTEALRAEARAHGVLVTEVLPISVQTRFFENTRGTSYQPMGVILTVDKVAHSVARCLVSRRPHAEVLPYRGVRAVFVLNALLPDLFVKVTGRLYARSVHHK